MAAKKIIVMLSEPQFDALAAAVGSREMELENEYHWQKIAVLGHAWDAIREAWYR